MALEDIINRARTDSGAGISTPAVSPSDSGPVSREIPRAGVLTIDDVEQQYALLLAHGVFPDPDQLRADVEAYVARLTSLTGDAYWAEVERLLNRSGLLGLARRVEQKYLTELGRQAAGDGAEFVRVGEGDSSSCGPCDQLAGAMGTYDEHVGWGLPGSASCLGGENCRCQLLPVEER